MSKKKEIFDSSLLCPIRYGLGLIGGKWKLAIICILSNGEPKRYGEIKKRLSGITNMMLTQSLKELESDNLVSRKQYNEIPPKVEYRITESGKSLFPALHLFAHWGIDHINAHTNNTIFCGECQNGNTISEHDHSTLCVAINKNDHSPEL
jgi:DNA-binding HxlR family transcriptional regulator